MLIQLSLVQFYNGLLNPFVSVPVHAFGGFGLQGAKVLVPRLGNPSTACWDKYYVTNKYGVLLKHEKRRSNPV